MRKIIHIDMDAFFASVEQRDNPEYRNIPLAVGFDGPRGVVSTASYEARKFGVRSAMPIAQAKRRCSHLTIVMPRMKVYKEVSGQVREIFHQYTDLVEPLSLDEAFLDVTDNKFGMESALEIASEIRAKIFEQTQLTASVGVSYNKFLAKISSDMNKPNGIFVVNPEEALDFIAELPIEKFWGVGPKTAQTMHRMGIFKGEQLRAVSLAHLTQVFGKSGQIYYDFVRGIDTRVVEPERERKSVGCEETFLEDIHSETKLIIELYHIVLQLVERLALSGFEGRTLTLKLKWDAISQHTKSITVKKLLRTKEDILPLAKQLLKETNRQGRAVRLLGLTVSSPANGKRNDFQQEVWEEGTLDFLD